MNAGIVNDYRKGMTVAEVAEKYAMKPWKVTAMLKEAGVQMRPKGKPRSTPDSADYDELAYTGGWVRDGLIMRPSGAA